MGIGSGKESIAKMALVLYLDDAMKVLLQHDFIAEGYIDEDGGAEVVRNELEQKCYSCLPGKDNEVVDKLRIENAELIQRMLQLEKELARERAYNYAIVTVIKNNNKDD